MAEDDVERLVAEIEHGQCAHEAGICYPGSELGARLARIVRELLAEFQGDVCPWSPTCPNSDTPREQWCPACMNRALRERLNKIARGEEA